jgi:flagellar biosynthesis protein FlhF
MNLNQQPDAGQRIFRGRTPREAIGKARAALGRDAVILSQQHRDGEVEIVASVDFPEIAPPLRGLGEHVRGRLAAAGFEPGFSNMPDEPYSWQELPDLFRATLQFASPGLPLTGAYRFVGAPGVGKTTTIIKLLAEHVLRYGRHGLQLISTDNRRLAG